MEVTNGGKVMRRIITLSTPKAVPARNPGEII
jgi:hypothetical protein